MAEPPDQMPDSANDRFLDSLLDASLRRVAAAEPLAGLDDRILARLRSAPPPRPWRLGVLAGAALAAVAIFLAVVLPPRAVAPARTPPMIVTTAALPAPPLRTMPLPRPARPRIIAAARAPEPRPVVFPAPYPLSAQEKLLLAYIRQTPPEEVGREEPDRSSPLLIAPIRITPLEAAKETK